jgi:hypothetical protein
MGDNTAQKIHFYYSRFSDREIIFNTDVIASTGLLPVKVSIKCLSETYPCILYVSSMIGARILVEAKVFMFDFIKKANNNVSLRLFFLEHGLGKEISFFIHSKVKSHNKYQGNKPNLFFMNLEFLNKPPDDFILILGGHIENESKMERRFQERIVINDTNQLEFGIQDVDTFLFIEGKGKKCVLNEISIFSAKVLMEGLPEDYMNKRVILLMKAQALKEMGEMVGEVTRCDTISKVENLISLIITFDQEAIPPVYKMWIGECLEAIKLKRTAK